MAGLDRERGSNERALVPRAAGFEAVALESGTALAKMPCWEAVKIPRRLTTSWKG